MIEFADGPAKGVVLQLQRAPLFLRVVSTDCGSFDALDLLSDTPAVNETIHVYRREGAAGAVHICFTGKRGRREGAWLATGTYRLCSTQPDDATVRDTKLWRAWATARYAELRNPTTTIAGLRRAVEEEPTDLTRRLILADALEEAGLGPEAKLHRAMKLWDVWCGVANVPDPALHHTGQVVAASQPEAESLAARQRKQCKAVHHRLTVELAGIESPK